MRRAVMAMSLAMVIGACGDDGPEPPPVPAPATTSAADIAPGGPELQMPIQRVTWETTGGGDLRFTLAHGEKGIALHVDRARFQAADVSVTLTPAHGEAYTLAEQLLRGTLDPATVTFEPSGATGTWTKLTVLRTDGASAATENIDATGKLSALYDAVVKFAGGE